MMFSVRLRATVVSRERVFCLLPNLMSKFGLAQPISPNSVFRSPSIPIIIERHV